MTTIADIPQEWWNAIPDEDLIRVYDLMKAQGTRPLPLETIGSEIRAGSYYRPAGPLPLNICPICGHEFDDVYEANVCPVPHYHEQVFTPEELISSDSDYAWCV